MNQTYQNLEFILVDDSSLDNCGLCVARNAGLVTIQGEYLMLVDSDDWMK